MRITEIAVGTARNNRVDSELREMSTAEANEWLRFSATLAFRSGAFATTHYFRNEADREAFRKTFEAVGASVKFVEQS